MKLLEKHTSLLAEEALKSDVYISVGLHEGLNDKFFVDESHFLDLSDLSSPLLARRS